MRRIIFLSCLIAFCDVSFAEETAPKLVPTIMIGTGVLFEKNNDNITESSRLPLALGFGARFSFWHARFEYESFRTADGNPTVSIKREHESALLWVAYEFSRIDGWMPYVALGTGVGRTGIETRVSGTYDAAKSTWDGLFALAAGLRADWAKRISIRPEVRYESAESFKTKDARVGVFIQLDYLF